jgi:predicted nuclease of predicted toxin-antitoxin system
VRWLIDECVDSELAETLKQAGHDVVYMSDVAPRSTDTEVIGRAHQEQRLLLTEDKDFGDIVFRQAKPVPGIVLIRIDTKRRHLKQRRLIAAVGWFGDRLVGHYTVIEVSRFRSRAMRV